MLGSRGDTIIEVMLAIAVFGMVAVGTISIMNQGTNAAQRALEITLVRNQLDAQAAALRAAHQAYTTMPEGERGVSEWNAIVSKTVASSIDTDTGCPDTMPSADRFVMDPRTASVGTGAWYDSTDTAGAVPYARVDLSSPSSVKSYGVWIEPFVVSGAVPARDFVIRACWSAAGKTEVPATMETIVRLYVPS